ncbi:MAG: hypothetical protein M3O01_04470 [Pseudomonadota bacterium]|nr:hypothetical protein [Pseudomonadota bacterium]
MPPSGSSPSSTAAPPDAWQATRAQTALATQIMQDEGDTLAAAHPGIGRQTGPDVRELFVSCAPELAMQQQFEHLQPEFIAVHDLATSSSRKLLLGIAAASSRAVQKLVIRRQGYGNPLATLEFVELPSADGHALRMYSTEVDADTAARQGLARVLLAHCRLGVMMVGDLPGHAIATALKPFRELMLGSTWPNRQLLLLPLAANSTLVAQGVEMARGTRVNVRTTPQVTRPADAWGYISGTWARLVDSTPTDGRRVPPLAGSTPEPGAGGAPPADRRGPDRLSMRAMPAVPPPGSRPAPQRSGLERYLHQLSELPGVASCCLFDVGSGMEVAHAGASPAAHELARQGKFLLGAMATSSRALGMGHALPDAAITLGSHHLLLRAVPGHPGLALHAVLDRTQANLTLLRLQVQRLDALLVPDPPSAA